MHSTLSSWEGHTVWSTCSKLCHDVDPVLPAVTMALWLCPWILGNLKWERWNYRAHSQLEELRRVGSFLLYQAQYFSQFAYHLCMIKSTVGSWYAGWKVVSETYTSSNFLSGDAGYIWKQYPQYLFLCWQLWHCPLLCPGCSYPKTTTDTILG